MVGKTTSSALLLLLPTSFDLGWDCILGEKHEKNVDYSLAPLVLRCLLLLLLLLLVSLVVGRFFANIFPVLLLSLHDTTPASLTRLRHAHARSEGWIRNLTALLEEHPQALVAEIGETRDRKKQLFAHIGGVIGLLIRACGTKHMRETNRWHTCARLLSVGPFAPGLDKVARTPDTGRVEWDHQVR